MEAARNARNFPKLGLALLMSFATGWLGQLATTPNIPTWYAALEKPVFNPPNWVFAPVWSTLYIMMAFSLYLVWTDEKFDRSKASAYAAFAAQLILNTTWTFIFFGLNSPEIAIIIILSLIIAIIFTMKLFWPISRLATYLLIPYLAWVMFATLLNISIATLN